MFPDEWETQTGARRKRRAPDDPGPCATVEPDDAEPPPSPTAPIPLEELALPRQILRTINTVVRAPATPAELDLDVILSRVPYREILENLYSREAYAAPPVQAVTRVYEEAYMREPMAGERPCVAGDLCECMFIDPCTPFVGVEFLLPGEALPKTPQFCVLCSRKVTQKLFYDILFTGKEVHGVIQRHGNLCNVPGEYARECVLVCPPHAPLHCMPLPIMSHQRNKYRVRLSGGVRTLDQLRIHPLLPVPPCRDFAKGDLDGSPQGAHAAPNPSPFDGLFVPGHPDVSASVAALHARLPYDTHAQIKIDCFLPCAAAAQLGLQLDFSPLASLRLSPDDAPQLGTLPDIGPIVRACIVGKQWGASFLAHCLHGCFPCPRPPARAPPAPDPASAAALVNILLASLLGLYPACIKRPPFPARAALYGRVHAVLASGGDGMVAFVGRHAPLLSMALSEYVCQVLPLFLPAEFEALVESCPVAPFFAAGPALFDQFRQDHVDTGREPWAALATAAEGVNERMTRVFRSKCRQPAPFLRRVPAGEATREQLQAALDAPCIALQECHRGNGGMLRGEYGLLLGGQHLADVAPLHSMVHIHPLPGNIRALQQAAVDALRQRCQRQARLHRVKHLCLLCERRGRRGSPRLCSRTFRVVCQNCDDHPDSMVAIDMIGRIVTVQGRHYVFAPCCATVQEYTGTGRDLLPGPCGHCLQAKGAGPRGGGPGPQEPGRRGRPGCVVCGGTALARAHEHLDHVAARLCTVYLCQRHTPPEDWIRGVCNRRQFNEVCHNWELRGRAPHRRA